MMLSITCASGGLLEHHDMGRCIYRSGSVFLTSLLSVAE